MTASTVPAPPVSIWAKSTETSPLGVSTQAPFRHPPEHRWNILSWSEQEHTPALHEHVLYILWTFFPPRQVPPKHPPSQVSTLDQEQSAFLYPLVLESLHLQPSWQPSPGAVLHCPFEHP
nr:hypothetical protein 20 [bacterium]